MNPPEEFPYSFTLERYEWEIVSLAFLLFMLSALILKPLGLEITFTSSSDLLRYLIAPPLIFVVAVHEGLHAGVARLLGGKVEFGLSVFGKINLAPYVAVRTPPLRKGGKWVYVITTPVLLSVVAYILAFALHSPPGGGASSSSSTPLVWRETCSFLRCSPGCRKMPCSWTRAPP